MKINLPWPPKELSPNARVHWSKRSKAAKTYRHSCFLHVRSAQIRDLLESHACSQPYPDHGRLHLWIDFYPPDRRHRDDDNLIAAFKSGRDGIADALDINDKRFICHPCIQDQLGKPDGYVEVTITTGATRG